MDGLAGKRAVVTGAARGIGLATARRLAREGARVALVDVDGGGAERAAAGLTGALALEADVADEPAIAAAVGRAAEAFGGLDVVVANAAVQPGDDDRADRLDDSASKAAMLGLVAVMAADLAGDGVRVNAVLPGITDTPMNDRWRHDPALREEVVRPVPLRRAADPGEIAAVIAFLASDDASYVTGARWAVEGGLTAV